MTSQSVTRRTKFGGARKKKTEFIKKWKHPDAEEAIKEKFEKLQNSKLN